MSRDREETEEEVRQGRFKIVKEMMGRGVPEAKIHSVFSQDLSSEVESYIDKIKEESLCQTSTK